MSKIGNSYSIISVFGIKSPILNYGSFERLELRDGWEFGEGLAPSKDIINNAFWARTTLINAGFSPITNFPATDGSLLVVGYSGEYSVEIICVYDGSFDITFEICDEEAETMSGILDRSKLNSIITVRAARWGCSSAYYTPFTLIEFGIGTEALHLGHPETGVFQSSRIPASYSKGKSYVRTYGNITPIQPQVRYQHFG